MSSVYTSGAKTLFTQWACSVFESIRWHIESIKSEVPKVLVGLFSEQNICILLSNVHDCLLGPVPHYFLFKTFPDHGFNAQGLEPRGRLPSEERMHKQRSRMQSRPERARSLIVK